MTNTRTRQQEEVGEEPSHSRASPVLSLLGVLALVVCCALPFLVIAAGGLSLSLIFGSETFIVMAAAIVVVLLLVVIGAVVRSKSRNKSRQTKTNRETCCR